MLRSLAALAGTVIIGISAYLLTSEQKSSYTPRTAKDFKTDASEYNTSFFDMMRSNPVTGSFEVQDYLKAFHQVSERNYKRSALNLQWASMGPDNIGGRTRAMLIDKDNPDLIWAGSTTGGLFRSTNGGNNWVHVSLDWPTQIIGSLIQDGDGVLYAGTGSNFSESISSASGGDLPGQGIFRSTDNGNTWTQLQETVSDFLSPSNPWSYVNRMGVSKSKNANGYYTLYAGTGKGLWVSEDRGESWTQPFTNLAGIAFQGSVDDVVVLDDDKVIVSYNNAIYYSTSGADSGSYVRSATQPNYPVNTFNRMSLRECPLDNSVVYAFASSSTGGNSGQAGPFVFRSDDGGENWAQFQPLPPTETIDPDFMNNFYLVNPVEYNQALSVFPNNCDRIALGAVGTYLVDGSWISWLSISDALLPALKYVHADKHFFLHSQHDDAVMFMAHDGGISRSDNATTDAQFFEINRNYTTTQYYGIAASSDGQVIGGTQDNGTHLINPNAPLFPRNGERIYFGDGFDCQTSTIGPFAFVSSQFGNVGKYNLNSGSTDQINEPGASPFWTVIKLWENKQDSTSKDSLYFIVDTIDALIGTGTGNNTLFEGVHIINIAGRAQPNGRFVPGSFRYDDVVLRQTATDKDANGILYQGNKQVGTINYTTGAYSIRWDAAPALGSGVNVHYQVTFAAGDEVFMNSSNQDIPLTFTLPNSITTGDTVPFVDSVQTILVVNLSNGFLFTRDALRTSATFSWVRLLNLNIGTPLSFEFSRDGKSMFIGNTQGNVYRVDGIDNLYEDGDQSNLNIITIFNTSGAASGLALHPTDDEKLLLTTGGYRRTNHVFEISNAISTQSSGQTISRILQGDLEDFPVYDGEYNINNPRQVLLGTELGVYTCDDIEAGTISWNFDGGQIGRTVVTDLVQQKLPFNEASNYGMFYAGTWGRGIWSTDNLVGIEDEDNIGFGTFADGEIGMSVYPNPVTSDVLSFDLVGSQGEFEAVVMDLQGKVVKQKRAFAVAGEQRIELSVADLTNGTYVLTVTKAGQTKTGKFVVVR